MTTPITDAGGSTPSDEVVTAAMLEAFWVNMPSPYEIDTSDAGAGKECIEAVLAAMPAPSVDPVGEVGKMIARLREFPDTQRDLLAATLLQQLADEVDALQAALAETHNERAQVADDNSRLTKMLTMEDS